MSSTTNTHSESTHSSTTESAGASSHNDNRWVSRLEDLLKVKNLDDLKGELARLASEIKTEIQKFDINEHLSPTAKVRLKSLEKSYNDVMKAVTKVQKQFDREFGKTLRVLKTTRTDAEKQLKDLRARITKHRGTLVKASKGVKGELKKRAKKAVTSAKKHAKARLKK